MTPLEFYHQQVDIQAISFDPEQVAVMMYFDKVHHDLQLEHEKRAQRWTIFRKPQVVTGLYLWGGVGIGKTFMMDCFYQTVPFAEKMRIHFHQFMHLIHEKLTAHQGEADPLQVIASEMAKQAHVICFDELVVSDITDAMLLGRLFKALFGHGVCLIATSNLAPDDLYKNGLQRSQFLPAIALLKQQLTVLHLPSLQDYRLRHLKEAGVFYTPLTAENEMKMEKSFALLAANKTIFYDPIQIHERAIAIKKRTDDIIWFEFNEICAVPRSQNDYLALAEHYKTIFISHIPIIAANEKDVICLFINFVDVMYDSRIRLVLSAEISVEKIYQRGYKIMEFARTNSRLLEMQSEDYFSEEFNRRQK